MATLIKAPLNILVISGSPRKNGNSEHLSESFCKGAQAAGHTVTTYHLSEITFSPCLGCESCHKNNGNCIQKDRMKEILDQFDHTDLLVLVSPVYFFFLSAQIKAFIDRLYSRIEKPMRVTQCVLLLTANSDIGFSPIENYYQILCQAMHWESLLIEKYCGEISSESLNALSEKVFHLLG